MRFVAVWLCTFALAACLAPRDRPDATTFSGQQAEGSVRVRRHVVMASTRDAASLAIKLENPGASEIDFSLISNSPLAVLDPTGTYRPLLAAELPSQDRGTWTVRPDGTMSTIWRIRQNALWHDGEPVTARDFAFALDVYRDPAIDVPDREPESFMDRIEILDDATFVIHWASPYMAADQLNFKRLPPLPEHVIGRLYVAGDKQGFQNDPFWSSAAYVGDGPFQIVEWEPGVQHRYRAFDRYFLGRPRIDELIVRIIPDENAALAAVLAGDVDFSGAAALSPQGARTAEQEAGRAGGGTVARTMGSLRAARFQYDPSSSQQPALRDVRVRRAIARGIDRAAVADLISAGTSIVAETPIAPGHPLYERVQRVVTKHPYDPSEAAALLADAGWNRQGDALVNASGAPFTLNITGSRSASNDTEKEALAGYLAQLGMQMSVTSYGLRTTDREQIARFPGLRTGTALAEDLPNDLRVFTTPECPTADNRWVGENGGCWSNEDFDRLYLVATTSLSQDERVQATLNALKIMTEDVGILGLSHLVQHNWVRRGLEGPGSIAAGQKGGYTWNVVEWHWTN
ncbi:MAG TPA: peptide ABC transporter substrate-binding protein [Chloroflexota bacterium]|nr:peptide ABC transporter substrate-binding protein [Chloroflexota bacterium]